MREKSEKKKLAEGRGIISENEYRSWIKINERSLTTTGTIIHDPVTGLSLDLASQGEREYYWLFRFQEDVGHIYTQYPMKQEYVKMCADKLGVRYYGNVLSTDLVVVRESGPEAYSIKASRREFVPGRKKYPALIRRQSIEQMYWETAQIPFRILFREEVNHIESENCRDVMRYWNDLMVFDEVSMLKHLIARHRLIVPMDQEPLRFADLARSIDIRGMYEAYKNE